MLVYVNVSSDRGEQLLIGIKFMLPNRPVYQVCTVYPLNYVTHYTLTDGPTDRHTQRCQRRGMSNITASLLFLYPAQFPLPWELSASVPRFLQTGIINHRLLSAPRPKNWKWEGHLHCLANFATLEKSRHFGASCLATTHKHSRNIARKIPSWSAIFLKCREVSSEVSQCKW